jgi:AcrR family transcriptional regulator
MAAAREEFLTFGFEKASMRSIGERCGMTAAGLYRHCRDKEDLFDQLVSPSVERLNTWLKEHVERYVNDARSSREPQWRDSWTDMMREVVYPHMEDYILLVAKSGGTKYENFLHDLTETGQKQFLSYLPVLRKLGYPVWDIDPEALHLLLSAYSTALFEPVIHSYPPEDAIRCLDTIEAFFLPGWKKLMGF